MQSTKFLNLKGSQKFIGAIYFPVVRTGFLFCQNLHIRLDWHFFKICKYSFNVTPGRRRDAKNPIEIENPLERKLRT